MRVCVYVYVCLCMCMCACVCVYDVCVYVCVCVCVCMHVCVHIHMHVYMCACVHVWRSWRFWRSWGPWTSETLTAHMPVEHMGTQHTDSSRWVTPRQTPDAWVKKKTIRCGFSLTSENKSRTTSEVHLITLPTPPKPSKFRPKTAQDRPKRLKEAPKWLPRDSREAQKAP